VGPKHSSCFEDDEDMLNEVFVDVLCFKVEIRFQTIPVSKQLIYGLKFGVIYFNS